MISWMNLYFCKPLSDLLKKREALEELGNELANDTTKLSGKHNDLVKEQLAVAHSVEVAQRQRETFEREYDNGVKDLALVKERESALIGDK